MSLVDLMASLFSPKCSFEDSRDSRIFATNDDEHSGSKTQQDSGQNTWQGDGVEKWQVVENESESQNIPWQVLTPIWEYRILVTNNTPLLTCLNMHKTYDFFFTLSI
jgi:hypothetical protein